MDRRERKTTQGDVLRAAMQGWQSRIWTALPGVVHSFDAARRTCEVQPAVNGKALQFNGTWKATQMPLLLDCPVVFPCGGGVTLTFPLAPGDECLVVIASRCIDTWFASGYTPGSIEVPNLSNDPPVYRMHNLSDGFVLPGVRSLPRAIAVDPVNACLISDDGLAFVKLNPTTHAISVSAPGGINLNGMTVDESGNVSVPGTFSAASTTTGDGIVLETHTHTSATPGSPTSPPLP